MLRLSKLTDYGIVLLAHVARSSPAERHTARDLAEAAGLPLPTVSKLLKAFVRAGLLISHRGVKGGYGLAREARRISVAEIICALEGPIAVTDCSDAARPCDLEAGCPARGTWQRINDVIDEALGRLTLAEMARPLKKAARRRAHDRTELVQLRAGKTP